MPTPATVVWLTGLSGSGKSTLARGLAAALEARGQAVEVLDGDQLRSGPVSEGLGFSPEDRLLNVRRIAFIAAMLAKHDIVAIVPVIAPLRRDRDAARRLAEPFLEVFVNAPLATCEARDPKGHYARARRGELPGFTGVDAPYEAPEAPDVECRTDLDSPEMCVEKILAALDAG